MMLVLVLVLDIYCWYWILDTGYWLIRWFAYAYFFFMVMIYDLWCCYWIFIIGIGTRFWCLWFLMLVLILDIYCWYWILDIYYWYWYAFPLIMIYDVGIGYLLLDIGWFTYAYVFFMIMIYDVGIGIGIVYLLLVLDIYYWILVDLHVRTCFLW